MHISPQAGSPQFVYLPLSNDKGVKLLDLGDAAQGAERSCLEVRFGIPAARGVAPLPPVAPGGACGGVALGVEQVDGNLKESAVRQGQQSGAKFAAQRLTGLALCGGWGSNVLRGGG